MKCWRGPLNIWSVKRKQKLPFLAHRSDDVTVAACNPDQLEQEAVAHRGRLHGGVRSLDSSVRDTNESRNVWTCRWSEASSVSAHSHFSSEKNARKFLVAGLDLGLFLFSPLNSQQWIYPYLSLRAFWAAVMTFQSVNHTHWYAHSGSGFTYWHYILYRMCTCNITF